MTDYKNITKFLFESGQLERVPRSGFTLIGIKNTKSVAEHQATTALISYILAKLEKADPEICLITSLIHDLPETRLNDLHKVGHRYIDFRKAEFEALTEQIQNLPKEISEEIKKLFYSYRKDQTKEGIIVRDADLLENALEAKRYLDQGHKHAQNWLDNIRKALQTESAKKILKEIELQDPNEWWQGLKRAER